MRRTTIALALGAVILLLSMTVSSSYQWVTANLQGPIIYSEKGVGLPLQFILFEVASPVGPSSYFKVDPFYLIADLFVWAILAYGALYLLNLPKRREVAVPSV